MLFISEVIIIRMKVDKENSVGASMFMGMLGDIATK